MKKRLLIVILQLASAGMDARLTQRNLAHPGSFETDPLARPFLHSTRGLVSYFSITTAGKIIVPYELRKHGHSKLAAVGEAWGIADSLTGVGYSWAHDTPQNGPKRGKVEGGDRNTYGKW